MKLKLFLEKHNLVNQILKFGVVGSTAFLIDTLVFWILIRTIDINSHAAIAIAFVFSLVYNYVLSTKWVFDSKRQDGPQLKLIFTLLSVIGLFLTELIYGFVVNCIFAGLMKVKINDIYEVVAKVISSGIVMVYNFVTRKIFLER